MAETWRASDPTHAGGDAWKSLPVPSLLGWWWALHLISAFLNQGSARIGFHTEDRTTMLAFAWLDLALLALDAALLLIEIRLVRTLTTLQESRADAMALTPPAAPPV
jgi:hypothetical protein